MTAPLSTQVRECARSIGGASSADRREAVQLFAQSVGMAILEDDSTDTAALTLREMARAALAQADRIEAMAHDPS